MDHICSGIFPNDCVVTWGSYCGCATFAIYLSALFATDTLAEKSGIVLSDEQRKISADIIYQQYLQERKDRDEPQMPTENNKSNELDNDVEEEEEDQVEKTERLLARERQRKYELEQDKLYQDEENDV